MPTNALDMENNASYLKIQLEQANKIFEQAMTSTVKELEQVREENEELVRNKKLLTDEVERTLQRMAQQNDKYLQEVKALRKEVVECRSIATSANDELQKVQSEHDAVGKSLSDVHHKLTAYHDNEVKYKARITELEAENRQLKIETDSAIKDLTKAHAADTERLVQEFAAKESRLQAEFKHKQEAMSESKKLLEKTLAAVRTELEQACSENDILQQSKRQTDFELGQTLHRITLENNQYLQELKDLREEAQESRFMAGSANDKLRKELADHEVTRKNLADIQNKFAILQKSQAELKDRIIELEAGRKQLKAEKESIVLELRKNMNTLKSENEFLIKSQTDREKVLSGDLEAARKNLIELENKLKFQTDREKALSGELEAERKNLFEVESNLTIVQKSVVEHKSRISELENENKRLEAVNKSTIQELQKNLNGFQSANDLLLQSQEEREKAYNQLQIECNEARQKLCTIFGQQELLQYNVDVKNLNVDQADKRIRDLLEENELLGTSLEKSRAAFAELQSNYNDTLQKLNEASEQCEGLTTKLKISNKRQKEFKALIEQKKAALKELRGLYEEAVEKQKILKKRLTNLRENLQRKDTELKDSKIKYIKLKRKLSHQKGNPAS